MNIAYFVDEYAPFFRGGLGTYAKEMTERLSKLDNRLFIFSRNVNKAPAREEKGNISIFRPELGSIESMLSVMIPQEVKKWPLEGQRFFGEALLYNVLTSSMLINEVAKREKIDLIVAHDWLASLAGCISKCNLNKLFVFHMHSAEQGRIGNGSETVKAMEREAVKEADRVITVSYAMKEHMISIGYSADKIRVVYNGVDVEKYDIKKANVEKIAEFKQKLGIEKDLVILFIGRLNWVKGADALLRAMPGILKEVQRVKLIMLGRGEDEKMLAALASSLGIEKNVIFEFRYVSEEERILHYAACDIACFPSKYEPFGIVCTEAMSMGKPVIVGARGISGLREQVIPHGESICGFHINPHDSEDIAKFCIMALKDEELREKMGKNARKRAVENFNWDKIAEQTLNIYREAYEAHSK